jgi:hypothetical protein
MFEMSIYDKDFYQRNFARLLNKALKASNSDAAAALRWLDAHYKPLWTILFNKHKAEMTDAYLDVRDHLLKRVDGSGNKE